MEIQIKEYLNYLNNPNKNKQDLFQEVKKISLQICFHKIPNLIDEKQIIW